MIGRLGMQGVLGLENIDRGEGVRCKVAKAARGAKHGRLGEG